MSTNSVSWCWDASSCCSAGCGPTPPLPRASRSCQPRHPDARAPRNPNRWRACLSNRRAPCVRESGGSGTTGATVFANCAGAELRRFGPPWRLGHRRGTGGWRATQRSGKRYAMPIVMRWDCRDSRLLRSRNTTEPPWYATRIPGGVTGTAYEGLPISIRPRYGNQAGRDRTGLRCMPVNGGFPSCSSDFDAADTSEVAPTQLLRWCSVDAPERRVGSTHTGGVGPAPLGVGPPRWRPCDEVYLELLDKEPHHVFSWVFILNSCILFSFKRQPS